MTARTHDAIAFASLITVATLYPPEQVNLATAATAVIANIVGGTLPDIDQASNRLWDLLPAGEQIAKIARKIFMGHRTLTHSFVGIFIVSQIIFFITSRIFNVNYIDGLLVYTSLMIGYISHLLADSVTKEGLPLLFPLKIHFGFPPFKSLRIEAGGHIEKFIILPGVAGYVFWFIGRNQEGFVNLLGKLG